MAISTLQQIIEAVKQRPKKRLVAAYANDVHTIEAVNNACDLGIIEGMLVGDEKTINQICKKEGFDINKFKVIHEEDEQKAAELSVRLINEGKADIIMKGLVSSDKYMRAILNKEHGLMPPKAILSHITIMQIPTYHKLLILSDVAIIPNPTLEQKIYIIQYAIDAAHALGIETPKVAIITATEQISYQMQSCVDAAILSKMYERGQFKNAIVEGPLALDIAIDKESAEIKKVKSPVGGDADCLIFPNIEAGNAVYKAIAKFCPNVISAMLVVGAKCPAILSSRSDSSETKMYSIAYAALMAK